MLLLLLVFFFFKQKTAYEMRISDWSSDVCSSDLKVGAMLRPTVGSVDRNIRNALPAWTDELIRGGPGGRLFVEGLAKATIVHLFRQYSDGSPTPMPMRGGLGAARLHRVIDYIEAHLSDDLSVRELATIAEIGRAHV